jgi:hypothetical protein
LLQIHTIYKTNNNTTKNKKKHTQQKNIMANTTDYERLLEEQKQFYEKKQKENLDTIVMLTEKVKKLQEENSEAEEDKYDGDDWKWVYGKMIVKNDDGFDDVVLCIAGGGDHWENWIMRPSMNYIENKDGLHPQRGQVLIQSSCGKYLSFQDEDYVCEGDECMCEYEHCVGS